MKSVMVLRLEIEHRHLLPEAKPLAARIADLVSDDLTDIESCASHRVAVTARIESAVMQEEGGFQITPSAELLRALGL